MFKTVFLISQKKTKINVFIKVNNADKKPSNANYVFCVCDDMQPRIITRWDKILSTPSSNPQVLILCLKKNWMLGWSKEEKAKTIKILNHDIWFKSFKDICNYSYFWLFFFSWLRLLTTFNDDNDNCMIILMLIH